MENLLGHLEFELDLLEPGILVNVKLPGEETAQTLSLVWVKISADIIADIRIIYPEVATIELNCARAMFFPKKVSRFPRDPDSEEELLESSYGVFLTKEGIPVFAFNSRLASYNPETLQIDIKKFDEVCWNAMFGGKFPMPDPNKAIESLRIAWAALSPSEQRARERGDEWGLSGDGDGWWWFHCKMKFVT